MMMQNWLRIGQKNMVDSKKSINGCINHLKMLFSCSAII